MWNGLSPLAKIALFTFTILIVLAVIFLFIVAVRNHRNNGVPSTANVDAYTPLRPVVTHDDPIRGNPGAAVTIVEFGDFGCEACADMHPILAQTLDTFDGKVRLVWKDVAKTNPSALTEAMHRAARCAGEQGKFWEYHDALYTHFNERFTADFSVARSDEVGLDGAAFAACMETRATARALERGRLEAERLGVTATPTFFINDAKIVGFVPYETLAALMSEYAPEVEPL